MANKRANGEGSINKYIVNGVNKGWRASISVGRDENGKLIRKQFYGKTQKEVKEKLEEYKKQLSLGALPNDDKLTLEQWYYTWLFDYRIKDLKPKSFEKYEGIYRNYIKDTQLGRLKLKDLRATHLQKYYNDLMDNNKKPTSTIKSLNTRLKPCLSEAEKQGYIQKNYCKLVTLPKDNTTREIKVLTPEQQKSFIAALVGHELEMLFLTALSTGLRLGEILGLKWSDIDFNTGTLTVNRTLQRVTEIDRNGNRASKVIEQLPKTKNSIRTIPIPKNILIKLKDYKVQQSKNKLQIGELYSNNDYVFCDKLGYPLDDKRPNRNLKSILAKLGIEPLKFHGLRHTYATRLFEANVPPKTVQVLMGHYDISITMDIYTHVMETAKLEAVEKLNDIFEL
ncbi:tyrosine-type recombinase/integrase [Paraclostridium sordellii]|uniref:tyrosine-type recombinase/integrase n=1 Tax=Paraclostridium sordellii TaxID=1505 RepID=UPI001F05BCCC|nr:site-specific integrase [Paeniclostridium sordellii]MCH1964888.1 site-specific integrase [Paeniclostridium sordellii]